MLSVYEGQEASYITLPSSVMIISRTTY